MRHHKEQTGCLKRELSDVTENILSAEREEEDLLDKASALKKAFSGLNLQIEYLLNDPSSSSLVPETIGVKLPKQAFPLLMVTY